MGFKVRTVIPKDHKVRVDSWGRKAMHSWHRSVDHKAKADLKAKQRMDRKVTTAHKANWVRRCLVLLDPVVHKAQMVRAGCEGRKVLLARMV